MICNGQIFQIDTEIKQKFFMAMEMLDWCMFVGK